MGNIIKIALAGNPNSGKSSLFNSLTGLNQRVGNFPGVTVDKKTGVASLSSNLKAHIIDLPGIYSLYPRSADEYIAYETLLNPNNKEFPELIIVVADAANLKRNLLFCTQIQDLNIPVILALTMVDVAKNKGIRIDTANLSRELGVPVIVVNPRKNKGVTELKQTIIQVIEHPNVSPEGFIEIKPEVISVTTQIVKRLNLNSNYAAQHIACAYDEIEFIPENDKIAIGQLVAESHFSKGKVQAEEVVNRYDKINQILKKSVIEVTQQQKQLFTDRIDDILLHKIWGNVILFLVLLIMFQAIFWLASYPMDWIDAGFGYVKSFLGNVLPQRWWSDLLINGLISGIGGIAIFIPQIAILFGLITILEDTGYMARISFLSDRTMRSVGLNGRSSMPLISGMACAIPAVMAARIITDRKERLITILVTPLMSCSARLPVYTILIALVIPNNYLFGFISLQGLVLMALYLLGFAMALIVAKVMHIIMKGKSTSLFLMELPVYKAPRWKNVFTTMFEKSKIFVSDAGKVILVISLILWGLATYGPISKRAPVERKYTDLSRTQTNGLTEEQKNEYATEKLETSYAGIMGHAIEPVIKPLGYDWKLGIALISSFAAREVFVGTMSTLYSVGEQTDDISPLKEKMRLAKRPDGTLVYNLATGCSLMVFYVFAMMCMSTLAIVKRETKSWKWPIVQTIYMSAIAYGCSFLVFQILK